MQIKTFGKNYWIIDLRYLKVNRPEKLDVFKGKMRSLAPPSNMKLSFLVFIELNFLLFKGHRTQVY